MKKQANSNDEKEAMILGDKPQIDYLSKEKEQEEFKSDPFFNSFYNENNNKVNELPEANNLPSNRKGKKNLKHNKNGLGGLEFGLGFPNFPNFGFDQGGFNSGFDDFFKEKKDNLIKKFR